MGSHGMIPVESAGIVFYRFPAFDDCPWMTHAFSSRMGGISDAPYSSLNMGLHVGDKAADVLTNRARFLNTLGLDPLGIVTGEQVHGTVVATVGDIHRGRGARDMESALAGVDGLVTSGRGITLCSFYADCAPVFLADPVKRAVGIAHAGWKGAIGRIAQKAVGAMAGAYGSRPEDIRVGVGPHIGVCCYRIGYDLAEAFSKEFPGGAGILTEGPDGVNLDLDAVIEAQLADAGCRRENMHFAGLCTSCRTDAFYSHRAEGGATGRMAAVIHIN